jgi:hypothetical protein
VAGAPACSRKVRKILRLEARARDLLAQYERALATTTRTMGQARALLDDAALLEGSLTGAELEELHRGRAEALGVPRASAATPPGRLITTTPT